MLQTTSSHTRLVNIMEGWFGRNQVNIVYCLCVILVYKCNDMSGHFVGFVGVVPYTLQLFAWLLRCVASHVSLWPSEPMSMRVDNKQHGGIIVFTFSLGIKTKHSTTGKHMLTATQGTM